MSATIGVDLGSIAAKAIVYDPDSGEARAFAERRYKETGSSEIAKLSAKDVRRAAFEAIKDAVGAAGTDIQAIGFSTIMHSIVLVDADLDPVELPSEDGSARVSVLTYADNRAADLVREFKAARPDEARQVYQRTGCVVHPSYPIWKLRWLSEHEPRALEATQKVLSLSAYVVADMTGCLASSRSVASTLGYLNIHTLDWDEEVLAWAGVSPGKLPDLHEMTHTQPLAESVADELGLRPGLPVALGSGDGLCTHPGTGSMKQGMMTSTVGTTGAVRLLYKDPVTAEIPIWCYYLLDSYIAGNAITSGGNCLEWIREKTGVDFEGEEFQEKLRNRLQRGLDDIPVIVPFLYGERGPGWHEDAVPMVYDTSTAETAELGTELLAQHDPIDIYLAFMEGVLFNLYQCYENLVQATQQPHEIRATGGITRDSFWMQMKADIYNQQIRVPLVEEPVAMAAALIAYPGIDTLEDFANVAISIGDEYQPDPIMHERYMLRYQLYKEAYQKAVS